MMKARTQGPNSLQRNSLIAQDPLFSLADERHVLQEVEEKIAIEKVKWQDTLTQKVALAKDKIVKDFNEAIHAVSTACEETKNHFANSESTKPLSRRRLGQDEEFLNAKIGFLSRQVHARMDRTMIAITADKGALNDIAQSLSRYHQELNDYLPDSVIMISHVSTGLPVAAGRTLVEMEEDYLNANTTVNKQSNAASYASYRRAKRHISKHYRIDELRVRTAFLSIPFNMGKLHDTHLIARIEEVYEKQELELADAWNAMRFWFEAMAADIDDLENKFEEDKIEQIQKKISEHLEDLESVIARTEAALSNTNLLIAPLFDELHNHLTESLSAYFVRLNDLLMEDNLRTFSLRLDWRGAAGRMSRTVVQGTIMGKIYGLLARSPDRVKSVVANLSNSLQKEVNVEATLARLSDLPSDKEVAEGIRGLPAVYRRLFSTKPLTHQELLIGRDELVKDFTDTYRKWRFGRAATIAIIGPDGSGKTSLINCFENEIEGKTESLRLDFATRITTERELVITIKNWFSINSDAETAEALIPRLRQLPRQVLFIRNGHNLLFRQVGGRRTPEAFLTLISATRDHFLWVVSFKEYPWSRLDYLVKISNFFTAQMRTIFHGKEEVREALLLRQRASGFPIEFLARKVILKTPLYAKMTEEEAALQRRDRFFSELFDLTGGNMHSALYFWVLSLRIVENRCEMSPISKLDFSFIRRLSREYLFTLNELLCHGGLSVNEHMTLFRLNSQQSRLQLEYLRRMSIVEGIRVDKNGASVFYRVNPIFYHPVTAILRSLNILYH